MAGKRLKTVLPRRLEKGDTIGIVAPASPFDRDKFQQGNAVLESMGFKTAFNNNLFKKTGYLAGSDSHRALQMNRFFADKKINGIVCARGGFGSIRVLSLLDYKSIRKNPKCFVGFSDITALLSAINAKCGLVTFHGPTITALAKASKAARRGFYSALTSETALQIKPKGGTVLRSGTASGKIAGGNLTTLCHLVGTPFQPSFNGQILFLEDIGEAEYRIDRMLTQMKMAGCFIGIAGVVLGSFRRCGKIDEIFRIVEGIFMAQKIPILAGMPFGHERSNHIIPFGMPATLDADRKILSFHEPATVSCG